MRRIPVSEGSVEDVLLWPLTSDGTYSVQSAYRMLEADANSQKPSSFQWMVESGCGREF